MASDGSDIDISKLTDADKLEVQQAIQNSNNQMQLNKLVHGLTKTCWEKCISQPVSQGGLTSEEQSCATNCVSRWLESQSTIVKALTDAQRR